MAIRYTPGVREKQLGGRPPGLKAETPRQRMARLRADLDRLRAAAEKANAPKKR